ncbi:MAG: hypothetical protein E7549_05205 [Ruminococcaceae bacterium]|nr:hypothetical protein [Oscillospiraceae bacterium]
MEQKPKKTIRIHPAPPTALTQEIPTPDVVHTFEVPPRAFGDGEARMMPTEGHDDITSDVLGSYTGTPADGGVPEQDADDL